jgi:hypothetical protein
MATELLNLGLSFLRYLSMIDFDWFFLWNSSQGLTTALSKLREAKFLQLGKL